MKNNKIYVIFLATTKKTGLISYIYIKKKKKLLTLKQDPKEPRN